METAPQIGAFEIFTTALYICNKFYFNTNCAMLLVVIIPVPDLNSKYSKQCWGKTIIRKDFYD